LGPLWPGACGQPTDAPECTLVHFSFVILDRGEFYPGDGIQSTGIPDLYGLMAGVGMYLLMTNQWVAKLVNADRQR
jgi:hypothetical protein